MFEAVAIVALFALVLAAVAVLTAERCPKCRSRFGCTEGEWDGLEFRRCNDCGRRRDVDYRNKGA